MSEHQVTLPWPPKELGPNQSHKLHWAKKNRIAQEYKKSCWTMCKVARLQSPVAEGKIHVWLDFYPPDRRKRDEDNAIASMKHGLDGVAKAIDVDDSRFKLHLFFHEGGHEVGGAVWLRLSDGSDCK